MLKMSRKKYLLVEGRDDYYLIIALFDELLGSEWRDIYDIEIDKAGILNSVPGNRSAVETVVGIISKTNLRDKLVGFVDREFRGFDWDDKVLIDQIQKHFVDDRILWTRGHSAENYFLDEKILKTPFRDVSGEIFQKSYNLFKKNLDAYLRVASKLSITALNLGYLKKLRASIGWDIIEGNGNLDIEQWKARLSKIGLTSHDVDKTVSTYLATESIIDSANIETIRWFCDGHISFYLLWCAFARCAYEVTEQLKDKRTMAQNILKYGDETRFNSCASAWAKSAQSNSCEYPEEIFKLLDLRQTQESPS